ncbi:MAG: hypothetical protein FJ319_07955 [SAR202 cluster bacterium]|nr:hypothetical protein [SAR202 cluster bacterium]
MDRVGFDVLTISKARRNQDYFREVVLASYDTTCAITGLRNAALLVASHIIPWSQSETVRLNPSNGICLNALHDKAFDSGLMTFDEDYCLIYSDQLQPTAGSSWKSLFAPYQGLKLTMPSRFLPARESLEFHRNTIFIP